MGQKIDKGNETRVDGARAKQETYRDASSKGSSGADRMFGNGEDGKIANNPTGQTDGGYTGMAGALERNNDVRHPSSKIWVRRDRAPNEYLHTGGG